eukprot:1385640-Heterocapsa_arctica.AAC.1
MSGSADLHPRLVLRGEVNICVALPCFVPPWAPPLFLGRLGFDYSKRASSKENPRASHIHPASRSCPSPTPTVGGPLDRDLSLRRLAVTCGFPSPSILAQASVEPRESM